MTDWLECLFTVPSALQAAVVLSLVCAVGLGLGKVKFRGVSLGVAFVFFIGILAGHYGLSLPSEMLLFCETFGLSLFVYTLGLYVGPNFFGSFRHEGIAFNLWGLAVVIIGTAMAIVLCALTHVPLTDMVGILCGATTNTPALGAAQQVLAHLGLPAAGAALSCAVTYPLGVVGVILGMMFLRRFFVRPANLVPHAVADEGHTYVGQFQVVNPALAGKTIGQVAQSSHLKFIVSRVWRGEQVIVPMTGTQLQLNDHVLLVTRESDADALELFFGKKVEKDWNNRTVDWNHLDGKVESRVIVMTRVALNGKRLGRLQLRNTYQVNVSRVLRGDIKLLATEDLRLQYGDRLTVVGEHDALDNVEPFLGNAVQTLNEPNLGAIFFGLLIGLAVGAIPFAFPGMSTPVRLGIAGGPIVVGILVGALGPRVHFISYTTRSASLMLRKLGLALYLACLGIDAGSRFFDIVVRPEGLLWIGLGFVLTVVPVVLVGLIALRRSGLDFGTICGILCGSMANPMALSYASDTLEGETPAISYATVYPLSMFIRVVIAQVVVMCSV